MSAAVATLPGHIAEVPVALAAALAQRVPTALAIRLGMRPDSLVRAVADRHHLTLVHIDGEAATEEGLSEMLTNTRALIYITSPDRLDPHALSVFERRLNRRWRRNPMVVIGGSREQLDSLGTTFLSRFFSYVLPDRAN